jgi:hypothetical protein
MGKAQDTSEGQRPSRHLYLKTLCNLTILVACVVLFIGGAQEGVRTSKIVYNCLGVSAVIGLVFWGVIRAMASYEEINGGKA